MKLTKKFATGLVLAAGSSLALAQQPIVYPAKGQAPQQQQKDEGECHVWSKGNTGVDPAALAAAPAAAPSQSGGERARGAVRGALGGAAIGAIAGDTGKGAGIGAVAGTMAGGRQARQNQAAQQQQAQNQKTQQLNAYYRAFVMLGSCTPL